MIDQIINLIGRNAKFLAILLIGLITVNVMVQIYTHKTTALTAWKGGGFGMYTAPHADGRTVWLEMDGETGIAYVQLYPENKDLRFWINGISLKGGSTLQAISTKAENLRFYPTKENTTALIENASRIRWLDMLTGGITPKDGPTFKPSDIRVRIYDTVQDMRAGTVKHQMIYSTAKGDILYAAL